MDYSIILASSSQTRRELMNRLHLPYQAISPSIDETPQDEQHADDLAYRLAFEKAQIIAQQHPTAIVIGSDQVAWCMDTPQTFIGKPLTVSNAIQQLTRLSGKTVCFSTALSMQHIASDFVHTVVEHYQVQFRNLTSAEIERYVEREQPLHCAGSFKCEGLGISLFEQMQGRDQTTLMGLPMIQLCQMLRQFKINVP